MVRVSSGSLADAVVVEHRQHHLQVAHAGPVPHDVLRRIELLLARVGDVVGGHHVDGPAGDPVPEGVEVALLPQRRLADVQPTP